MNATAILSSDLLDIIFENRNKSYGAYSLRKTYNDRLLKSLLVVAGIITVFSFFMLTSSKISTANMPQGSTVELPPPTHINPLPDPVKPQVIPASNESPSVKNNTPVVVPDIQADSTIRTNDQLETIPLGNVTKPGDSTVFILPPGDGPHKPAEIIQPVVVVPVDIEKPMDNPEVQPTYPGGMQAFIKYLERNLHSPEAIDEGETVAVKVKFVVNYDGSLKSFSVIQTGGKTFDDEVLRVLKRMPQWVPGKSKGVNVSVNYTVPVKFTSQE